ncbi:MAG: MFS transporter [Defluviitaleaceae bacterium]|nr:MFS transporter [Defluviitaleaceae bacterium]
MEAKQSAENYKFLAAASVVLLFLGLIYAWSIFHAPFSLMFPSWTVSDLSMTFTISIIFFCVGNLASGRLTKRIGSGGIVRIAAALLLIGFVSVSRLDPYRPDQSLIGLHIFYGVFCGAGVGMGYNAVISSTVKRFTKGAGMILGILLMIYGFGGMILGSVINVLIAEAGLLRTFLVMAPVVAIVLVLGSFFIKPPDASAAVSNAEESGNDHTPGQMLRTKVFWLFFVWKTVICSAGLLVINSAAPIATAFGAPAALGLMVLIFNGAGRMAFGAAIDKLDRKRTMYISCIALLLAGASLYTGALLHNVALVFIGLTLMGACYGGAPTLSAYVVKLFFGGRHYSSNFSINTIMIVPAAIVGPLVSSILQERSDGSYNSTFLMIIGLAVAAFALNAALNKLSKV